MAFLPIFSKTLDFLSFPPPGYSSNNFNLPKLTSIIISSFEVLSIFSIIIQYILAFIKSSQFCPLLNEWNVIESEFSDLWIPIPSSKNPECIKKFQFNFATFYFILPSLVFGSLLAY
jgi:hypothetical protein